MKLLSTLTLGALLVAGAASGAATPTQAPTATPASLARPAQKHGSAKHCDKLARNQALSGNDAAKFVKECRAGRKPG